MKTAHVIRADGRQEEHAVRSMADVANLIGAETLDTVNLRDGRVMMVDDAGYAFDVVDHGNGHFEHKPTAALKPDNPKATVLYHAICVPGTRHRIVGDVVIVVDAEWA